MRACANDTIDNPGGGIDNPGGGNVKQIPGVLEKSLRDTVRLGNRPNLDNCLPFVSRCPTPAEDVYVQRMARLISSSPRSGGAAAPAFG